MDYLKDYLYESNVGVDTEEDPETKYNKKWSYQILSKDDGSPAISTFCDEHY